MIQEETKLFLKIIGWIISLIMGMISGSYIFNFINPWLGIIAGFAIVTGLGMLIIYFINKKL